MVICALDAHVEGWGWHGQHGVARAIRSNRCIGPTHKITVHSAVSPVTMRTRATRSGGRAGPNGAHVAFGRIFKFPGVGKGLTLDTALGILLGSFSPGH